MNELKWERYKKSGCYYHKENFLIFGNNIKDIKRVLLSKSDLLSNVKSKIFLWINILYFLWIILLLSIYFPTNKFKFKNLEN